MAKKDRNTLKKYFEAGRLPSSEQFADLIDSMLNVIEEGFDKTAEEGFKVSQIDNTGKLISFYENIEVKKSVWSLRLDMASGKLIFDNQVLESHRAMAAVLGVILKLPPIKQAMASQQMKSIYLEALVDRLNL